METEFKTEIWHRLLCDLIPLSEIVTHRGSKCSIYHSSTYTIS